jgi:hypothetical protein
MDMSDVGMSFDDWMICREAIAGLGGALYIARVVDGGLCVEIPYIEPMQCAG